MKKALPPSPISQPSPGSIGETGTWRVYKPVINYEKCKACGRCWVFCPETAITLREDGKPSIDYKWCKGCLICAEECKLGAITVEKEF